MIGLFVVWLARGVRLLVQLVTSMLWLGAGMLMLDAAIA